MHEALPAKIQTDMRYFSVNVEEHEVTDPQIMSSDRLS